jgi:hypothetical protein
MAIFDLIDFYNGFGIITRKINLKQTAALIYTGSYYFLLLAILDSPDKTIAGE